MQMSERFKMDRKKARGFEHANSEFERALCRNDEHVITNIYKLLLRSETEEEQVKKCMIKWAQNVGHSIPMAQWEDMWSRGLKCMLSTNLKENFYKMMSR